MLSYISFATCLTVIIQPAVGLAPKSAQVLNTVVQNCDIPVTASFNGNNTALNLSYDTTKVSNSTPNSLASITKQGVEQQNTCVVCTSMKWSDSLFGFVESIDFDFWHRLDPGLLEQVQVKTGVEGSSGLGWFEDSYIYGSNADPDTTQTYRTQTHQINASQPLLLDSANDHESLCVRTMFRIMARGGVEGASGELSKSSVFTQKVNLGWQKDRGDYCPQDRSGAPICNARLPKDNPKCCNVNGTVAAARKLPQSMPVKL